MDLLLDLKLLALTGLANAVPLFAKGVLGHWLAFPLDARATFSDGRRVLGRSKSIRGIILSILVTGASAPIITISWRIGAAIAAAAMAGDLFSSFVKRRLGLAPSSMALVLDQLPESILPVLVARYFFPLSWFDVGAIATAFFVLELLLSRILFALKLRDTPY